MRNSFVVFSNFISWVGKTTRAILFSRVLAATGKRVLVVDLDPNQNRTRFRFAEHSLLWDRPIASGIWHGDVRSQITPSLVINTDVPAASYDLHDPQNLTANTLSTGTRPAVNDYAVVIIDCPSTTKNPVVTAWQLADPVVTPTDFYTFDSGNPRYLQAYILRETDTGFTDWRIVKTKFAYNRVVELTSEIIGEAMTPHEGYV